MAGDLNKAIVEYEWLRAVIEGWPFDPLYA